MGRFLPLVAACSALALTACGHYSPRGPHAGDGTPPSAPGKASDPMGMMGQMDHQGPMHQQKHERMHEQMHGRMHGSLQGPGSPGSPGPMRGLGALHPMGAMQQGTMGKLGMVGLMAPRDGLGPVPY